MNLNKLKSLNLAAIGALLSLVTCYGALALISVLGMLGIAITVDNSIWAGAIIAFAILAVIGLGVGFSCHRNLWPVIIGTVGAAIITYTMLMQYDRMVELAGFVLLSLAAVWDWRIKISDST